MAVESIRSGMNVIPEYFEQPLSFLILTNIPKIAKQLIQTGHMIDCFMNTESEIDRFCFVWPECKFSDRYQRNFCDHLG